MTLSLSANKETKLYLKKLARIYGIAAVVTLLFSTVYEYNSHGVYSLHMICLFLYPLIGGTVVFSFLQIAIKKVKLTWIVLALYQAALLTFMAGSLISGILEIYGTTSPYNVFFWYLGMGCTILCILSYFIEYIFKNSMT